jgi:hypothetical protein
VIAVANPLLNDQAFQNIDRRTHVAKTLAVRRQFHVAADLVEFALEIVDAPAIINHRLDAVSAV